MTRVPGFHKGSKNIFQQNMKLLWNTRRHIWTTYNRSGFSAIIMIIGQTYKILEIFSWPVVNSIIKKFIKFTINNNWALLQPNENLFNPCRSTSSLTAQLLLCPLLSTSISISSNTFYQLYRNINSYFLKIETSIYHFLLTTSQSKKIISINTYTNAEIIH